MLTIYREYQSDEMKVVVRVHSINTRGKLVGEEMDKGTYRKTCKGRSLALARELLRLHNGIQAVGHM